MPRPAGCIALNRKQIRDLEQLAREVKGVRSLGLRAQIILECGKKNSDRAVAKVLRLGKFGNRTVGKWRKRFIEGGADGLCEKPRPGAPRKASDDDVEGVVADALESASSSSHKVAERRCLNQAAVSRILRAFGERVRDIVGIYMNPTLHALVLSVDERNEDQVSFLMRSGKPKPGAPKLFRLLDFFISADPGSEKSLGGHRMKQFRQFLDRIDRQVPPELDLYLILDSDAIDETAVILAEYPRFHLFSTPNHAAWLNQVDRWIALLTERQNERGSHNSIESLSRAIRDFVRDNSSDRGKIPKFFRWCAHGCHTGRARLWKTSGTTARHTSQPSIDINHEK